MPHSQPRPFYKYTSADTALKILETGRVRYASPLLFNDPFDVQSGLHFDFNVDALPSLLIDHISALVHASTDPAFVTEDDPWAQLVKMMRGRFPHEGFPAERFGDIAAEQLRALKEILRRFQGDYQAAWWDNFLPRMRVFSVSETKDSLLMWAHYGKDHTGVVFEFWSRPDLDNMLSVATPIIYVESPPPLFTATQWLNDICAIERLRPTELYYKYARIKSDHWQYEREWRVWDLLPEATSSLCDYRRLLEQELTCIYLGCRIQPDVEREIRRLADLRFPALPVIRTMKAASEYRLVFPE